LEIGHRIAELLPAVGNPGNPESLDTIGLWLTNHEKAEELLRLRFFGLLNASALSFLAPVISGLLGGILPLGKSGAEER
jgi:hypothetical protein